MCVCVWGGGFTDLRYKGHLDMERCAHLVMTGDSVTVLAGTAPSSRSLLSVDGCVVLFLHGSCHVVCRCPILSAHEPR